MNTFKYVFVALLLSASSVLSAQTWINGSIGIHTPNASITLGGNNYRHPSHYYVPPPVYVQPPPIYVRPPTVVYQQPPQVIYLPPPGVIVPNGSVYNPTWYNPNLRYDYRYVNPN